MDLRVSEGFVDIVFQLLPCHRPVVEHAVKLELGDSVVHLIDIMYRGEELVEDISGVDITPSFLFLLQFLRWRHEVVAVIALQERGPHLRVLDIHSEAVLFLFKDV